MAITPPQRLQGGFMAFEAQRFCGRGNCKGCEAAFRRGPCPICQGLDNLEFGRIAVGVVVEVVPRGIGEVVVAHAFGDFGDDGINLEEEVFEGGELGGHDQSSPDVEKNPAVRGSTAGFITRAGECGKLYAVIFGLTKIPFREFWAIYSVKFRPPLILLNYFSLSNFL